MLANVTDLGGSNAEFILYLCKCQAHSHCCISLNSLSWFKIKQVAHWHQHPKIKCEVPS